MKFRNLLPAAAAVLVTCLFVSAAQATISGSAHDFGSFGWSKNQICLPCHTTHNTIVKDSTGAVVGGPIWNHQLSTAKYDMYMDTKGNKTQGLVDTNSMLCLSCHDGTVALDSFGGNTGTQSMTDAKALIGTDLTNDHPIGEAGKWPVGATYMVDPALRDAKRIMPLRTLPDGTTLAVGCTSCHEPHNRANTDHMLWVNNAAPGTTVDGRSVSGSLLCMNCHKK